MASRNVRGNVLLSVPFAVALIAFTSSNGVSQAINQPVSPPPKVALLNLPVRPITGPGYEDGNIAQDFQIGNRHGHDPFRKQSGRQFQSADMNGGNSNYLPSVPILTLPGRGLSLSLNLYYNSQVWTNQGVGPTWFVYDHGTDWPAPRWSIGFGKVVQVGEHEGPARRP